MLNRVVLIGRLTRDPELRYTPSGTAVATFTLAVGRKFKRDETDFIPIVTWTKLAEHCANYLSKGRLVAVEGRIQVRTYETQEGQKRWVTEVVAEDVRFLEKAGSGSSDYAGKSPKNEMHDDKWSDLGREVNLEDVDLVDRSNDDDIPF
ncbi:MAG: single-stranded DNA-binding protein [Syntrophomonadaceae bacterium]|nr:single-stranded DNA-binding protein [Syntrophomonadaceae bacterium]MDD3023676.1 single-stranded DNA-binding protein [Syntrophomonadaceae bacterium]